MGGADPRGRDPAPVKCDEVSSPGGDRAAAATADPHAGRDTGAEAVEGRFTSMPLRAPRLAALAPGRAT